MIGATVPSSAPRILAGLLLASAVAVLTATDAAAHSIATRQDTETAQMLVRVVDENGAAVAGQEVTVVVFDDEQIVDEIAGTTEDDGAVLFRTIPAAPGLRARPVVTFGGFPYQGEAVELVAGGNLVVPVTVFTTIDDASSLHIDILHVVLTAMGPGEYHAIQVMQLLNVGAQASLGGPTFEGQRAGLVIPLPTGATNISPLPSDFSGLDPSALAIDGNRLLHMRPVPPGPQQIAIEYQLSTGAGRDIELTVPYPTSQLNLLIGPGTDAVSIDSAQLREEAPEEIEGQGVYANWVSDVVAAGDTVRFRIGPPGLVISVEAWALIGLGTALLAGVAASLWGGARMQVDPAARRRLIEEVARLDRARGSEEIDKAEHHFRRAAALEMIAELDRQIGPAAETDR